jgi:hypothetical protein
MYIIITYICYVNKFFAQRGALARPDNPVAASRGGADSFLRAASGTTALGQFVDCAKNGGFH